MEKKIKGVNYDRIKELFLKEEFIISNHARVRMFQRNISTEDIRQVVLHGEIIEPYPEDEPCSWGLREEYHAMQWWRNAKIMQEW